VAVRVVGTAPLERIDLVRSGSVAVTAEADGEREASWTTAIPRLAEGEYAYVRVVQRDGGLAWSSPIYAAESGSSTNTRTSRSSERR
jgi:spore germination protein YaaH